MVKIKPFDRPPLQQGRPPFSSQPYDVMSTTEELVKWLETTPTISCMSSDPKIPSLPADADPHDDAVYEMATDNFEGMLSSRAC